VPGTEGSLRRRSTILAVLAMLVASSVLSSGSGFSIAPVSARASNASSKHGSPNYVDVTSQAKSASVASQVGLGGTTSTPPPESLSLIHI